MAGVIGTGAVMENSALGGLMSAAQLEEQRNTANEYTRLREKAAAKSRTGSAIGSVAYTATHVDKSTG